MDRRLSINVSYNIVTKEFVDLRIEHGSLHDPRDSCFYFLISGGELRIRITFFVFTFPLFLSYLILRNVTFFGLQNLHVYRLDD